MTPSFLLLLCAAGQADVPTDVTAGPATGKVVVLDNDRTLEGEIEHDGDQYRIRRANGVTFIPAERVRKVCADRKEALAFLRQKANKEDPDERLKLARWCHLQGLREEALVEIAAALAIRPEHAESLRLQRYLKQWAKHEAENKSAPKTPALAAAEVKPSVPPVSITVDSMSVFIARIQPILMNACARCHSSSDNASAFRLERSNGIGQANRRAVQENLTAVLSQVHLAQPERSPLLIKSISAHGRTPEAPIRGRELPAYRTLEDWVRLTLANNPQLQDVLKPLPILKPIEPPGRAKVSIPAPSLEVAPMRKVPPATPSSAQPEPARAVPVSASPTAAEAEPEAAAESEFDQALFNRRFHPQGKGVAPPAPKKDGE